MNKKEFYEKIRIDENGNPQIEEHVRAGAREFYKLHPNSTIEWLFRSEEEVRTLKTNRYYWAAILPAFCPEHFGATEDVHEFYSKKYLTQEDVFDIREDTFGLTLAKITKYASRTRSTIKKEQLDDYTFKINWVRSTATLTKKMMKDYIDKVMLDGQEQGIEFEDFEKFDPYKNMR